jgi:alkanesulfonate monooxygenase SsuD/methylene tetrahydromethanopterin reductase-like flavin-dependent oxidoreductase (luciferase family)
MARGFSIDPDQGLNPVDELRLVKVAAELGYDSAWTPSGADASAFDRCLRWYEASGLPTGISAVPASGQPAGFYAEQAMRVLDATGKKFTLVVGSGRMSKAAEGMREYLSEARRKLPDGVPLYLAALGPLMIDLAAQLADGAAFNWCSSEQLAWSRSRLEEAAQRSGRAVPRVIEYIRTAIDDDLERARQTVATAAARYLRAPAYQRHFERMGVARDLEPVMEPDAQASLAFVDKIGAAGRPGQTRQQFERLAQGLDLPIVRVLVTSRGDYESARRVLEECRPLN